MLLRILRVFECSYRKKRYPLESTSAGHFKSEEPYIEYITMNGRYNLSIVGRKELVFECEFFCDSSTRKERKNVLVEINQNSKSKINRNSSTLAHLKQFIAYSSLDIIEERSNREEAMYLGAVDDFNNYKVFAKVLANGSKFIVLFEMPMGLTKGHLSKIEDNIERFLKHVTEEYLLLIQNPFYKQEEVICAGNFDEKLDSLAKRYLFGF